jgi:hypothetical protein
MSVLRSEWVKFATLRSTWWTLAAVAVMPVGVAMLVCATGSLALTDTVLSGTIGNHRRRHGPSRDPRGAARRR